ncbi:MAG: TRAP transporter small permease [Pseudomonadota bacterium]
MNRQAKFTYTFDRVVDFLAYLACVFVVVIMLSVGAEVVCRKLLGFSLPWVMEYSEFLLLYITFLGTTWLLKRDGHVNIEVLVDRLNPRTQTLVNMITSIFAAILCLVIAFFSAMTTWDMYKRGIFIVSMMDVPIAPLLAVIPVGFFLLFIQFLRRAYGYQQGWRVRPNDKHNGDTSIK